MRYKILAGYWGNNPRKLEDLIIKNSTFEVFGLKTFSELGIAINDPTPGPEIVPEPTPGMILL